ncbi:MAG: hypothetical protein SFU98_12375 [Leptospiraceae bacterium]|nr:hypothetical protein [Leptospiraceae bacterium]
MNSITNSNQISLPSGIKNDIYSLDKMFLSEFPASEEIWDFGDLIHLDSSMLSFTLMRALLFKEIKTNRIKLENVTKKQKLIITKLGLAEFFTNNFHEMFIPTIAEKENGHRLMFYNRFIEESHFLFSEVGKKSFYSGGGILKLSLHSIQTIVEELFIKFQLSKMKGSFYLRTNLNSYFYILNPENKSRIFYVQEKRELPKNFIYFQIETH